MNPIEAYITKQAKTSKSKLGARDKLEGGGLISNYRIKQGNGKAREH